MWEILHGKLAFSDKNVDMQLQIQICNNLRPTIVEGAPKCYVSLMKMCWTDEQEKRPSAMQLYETFIEWQNDENILLELSKSDEILKNIKYSHLPTYSDTTSLYLGNNYIFVFDE